MKIIELHKSITASNEKDANALRMQMKFQGTLLINLMSSPGSGKTTLLSSTIQMLEKIKIAVLEADIESAVDAERIEQLGAVAVQVHTDGMCHMDAGMTKTGIDAMKEHDIDLAFLENVGNLICPAEYDTGDDKPLKYPLMFEKSDALVISKIDALPYFDFDLETCIKRVKRLNPNIKIFPLSAKTKEGMKEWLNWLREETGEWKVRR